jgi:protein required for attachment to host cells
VNKLAIPHDAMIFVGDGRKALFLRNDGDEKFPNLKTEQVFADENPPTHEQGTDKPGTAFGRPGAHRRSSVDQTDWHHLEEHRFVERVAAALESVVRSRAVPALVIAAPPRTTCAGPFMPT